MRTDTLHLIGLAMAPAAIIITYVWFRDRHDKEPLSLLAFSFLLGTLSVIPAVLFSLGMSQAGLAVGPELSQVLVFAFVTVALSEELSKFIFLRFGPYRSRHFNEPYDGIIYAMMIGMGFASAENVMYVFGQETFEQSVQVARVRALTAVPAHATFAALMGYFAGLARFSRQGSTVFLLTGLLLATLFHGSYDFFLMQQSNPELTVGAIVSLMVGVGLSLRAIRLHQRVRIRHDEAT